MKKVLHRILAAIGCTVVGLLLFPQPASSRAVSATAGRPGQNSDSSCWDTYDNFASILNFCGSGTPNTKTFLIPAPFDAWTTYNVAVRVQAQYLQTGPWVSCVAYAHGDTG